MADYSQKQAQIILTVIVGVVAFAFAGFFVYLIVSNLSSDEDENLSADSNSTSSTINSSIEEKTKENLKESQNIQPLVVTKQPDKFNLLSPDNIFWYPTSDQGPEVFTETRSIGFKKTEEGAGLAAANIYLRMNFTNSGYLNTVVEQSFGVGKPGLIKVLEDPAAQKTFGVGKEEVTIGSPLVGTLGWNIDSYTDESASVTVFFKNAEVISSVKISLIWVEDDWKVIIPESTIFPVETTSALPRDVYFEGAYS